MNLLFVHDHIFRKVDNDFYSTGGISDEVLDRYTAYADRVTVIARVLEVSDAATQWTKITNSKVSILGTNSLKYKGIKSELEKCSALIVRLPSFLGMQAIYMNKSFRKPYLIEMVGCPWDSLWNHSLKGKMVALPVMLITKRMIYKAPMVLYVTNEFLQNRYPTKGINIGCSDVVLQATENRILQNRLQRINNCAGKLVIGTIAAVNVKYKGQQYIIEALGALKKQGIMHFEYQIVGNGCQGFLKLIAQKFDVIDQIVFLGGLPHDKVFEWLDTIDIYIQPSLQEGLPRALIEAMSRGLLCYGSTTGGIPELLHKDYIFHRTKNTVKNISIILKNITTDIMKKAAVENFKISQNYEYKENEKKRQAFLKIFMNNVKHGEP